MTYLLDFLERGLGLLLVVLEVAPVRPLVVVAPLQQLVGNSSARDFFFQKNLSKNIFVMDFVLVQMQ